MTDYNDVLRTIGAEMARLSNWLDTSMREGGTEPGAAQWHRIAKGGEEAGELIEAYIGWTGQNPRKGVTNAMNKVEKEAFDLVFTGPGIVEHLHGNDGLSAIRMLTALGHLIERAEASGMSVDTDNGQLPLEGL